MNRTRPNLLLLLAVFSLCACGASEVRTPRVSIVANLSFSRPGDSMHLDVEAVKAWLTAHGPVQTATEAQFGPAETTTLSIQTCHQNPHPVWQYRAHAIFPDGSTFDTAPIIAFTVADQPSPDSVSAFAALDQTSSYTVAADGSLTDDTPAHGWVPEQLGNSPYVEQHLVTVDSVDVLVDSWSCGSGGAGPFTPN